MQEGQIMGRLPIMWIHPICICAFLFISDSVLAQSWKNLQPVPASAITWQKGFIGTVDNDKTRLYHLTGRGSLGIPFMGSGPGEEELKAREAFIRQWLKRHPNAVAIPVEAYPFFSKTVARIYIWVQDGPDFLNLDLVREGLITGSHLMTNLRFEDLYVTSKQVWNLRDMAASAEKDAAEAKKGIWADPEYQEDNPPGHIEYPSLEKLSRYEKAAKNMK